MPQSAQFQFFRLISHCTYYLYSDFNTWCDISRFLPTLLNVDIDVHVACQQKTCFLVRLIYICSHLFCYTLLLLLQPSSNVVGLLHIQLPNICSPLNTYGLNAFSLGRFSKIIGVGSPIFFHQIFTYPGGHLRDEIVAKE